MEREKGFEAGKLIKSAAFLIVITILLFSGGCSKQFARLEANQAQLKLMSQSNAEQMAIIAKYIEQNQSELTEKIQQLHNELQVALDNQEVLKTGFVVAHNEAAKINANVAVLEQKQSKLYDTMQANNSRLNEKAASLEQGQSTILAGVADSKNQTLKVSSEVAALGNTQAKFHEASQKSIQQIAGNLSVVSDNQESLKAGLIVSNNTSSKIAEDVTALAQKQSQLYSTVQSNNSSLNEKVASLGNGQNTILAGIADSKNRELKLSSEVASLDDKQSKFQEAAGNSISDISNNLTLVIGNQEILKAAEVLSRNETVGIANSLDALGRKQAQMHEVNRNDMLQLTNTLSEINQNQNVLKVGLVVSHNETAGVSNRITSLGETQKELKLILQDSSTQLSQKVAALEKSQSNLQNGIENVKNETKELNSGFSSFTNGQTNLREAVESYNKQLNERVTVVEKSQEQWQETIKQMQQSVQQVAGNISTFEQNISKLQEIFQGKIGELTSASNSGSKGQLDFQEKIKADLAALSEAVSVLKQGQTQMQQKIEEVQTSTKSMSVEFPAAIEQLKKDINVNKETEYSTDK